MQACYRVRQIAQDLWEPLLDRDKDYIATPKANGYRSLHSTLLVPSLTVDVLPEGRAVSMDWGLGSLAGEPKEGLPLELQIRTARRRLSLRLSSPQPHRADTHVHRRSHEGMELPLTLSFTAAGMHEEAQSGEAAHAAYKGGLAPGLARRLHSFLDLSAIPPALPAATLWNSSEAAAEELFRSTWPPH